jgi:hypothetical protein
MKVLHITPDSNGYEEVTLLANAVNAKNDLAVIRRYLVLYFTGGFILNDTPEIRKALDAIPKQEQYDFVAQFRSRPYVKQYYEEQ